MARQTVVRTCANSCLLKTKLALLLLFRLTDGLLASLVSLAISLKAAPLDPCFLPQIHSQQ